MFIDIAIICPKDVEYRELRKILPKAKSLVSAKKRIPFSFGEIKGEHNTWHVAVVAPPRVESFALWTNSVVQDLQPNYLILAGMAGGLKDVAIGDIVIGTSAGNYESGKETEQGFASRPQVKSNDCTQFLNLALRISRTLEDNPEGIKYFSGEIVSGSKVIAEIKSETFKNIQRHYNAALAVEMEAFDFSLAAAEAQVQYINIRGISDLIQNKKQADEKGYQSMATGRVRSFLHQLIKALPKSNHIALHTLPIKITSRRYAAGEWRKSALGKLMIYDKRIEIIQNQKTERIRHIDSVSRYKMPGDMAANWVEVKYTQNGQHEIIYLSLKSKLDLGSWLGGSKNVYLTLSNFFKTQIQLAT